jgi:hypothetical protein
MMAMRTFRVRILLAVIAGLFVSSAESQVRAQDITLPGDFPPRVKKRKPKPDILPAAPNRSPSLTIPVSALGYGTPSSTYLGRHYSLFTLDFLGDNRLLFSLRAPGLLARETGEANADRQMKAFVLKLPEGSVESQTIWTVPDRAHYLWMLRDGKFLLRDRDGLKTGDASLQTKLLLPLTGEFQALEIEPGGRTIVVHTLERTGSDPTSATEIVTRVVQVESSQVLRTTHSSALAEQPINAEGSLEVVHDNKYDQWSLRLTPFSGDPNVLGRIESTCLPSPSFVSDSEILVAGCDPAHVPKLTAVTTDGKVLWQSEAPLSYVPPLLMTPPDGSRFVRESIVLKKKPSAGTETLWVKAVKGQVVRVFDAATGKVIFETPVAPILDGGGNVALSPAGRLALLNNGSIQVFDLPSPPPPSN